MNLYILTHRENVKQRWSSISSGHELTHVEVENLMSAEITQGSCVLVHIDSMSAEQLNQLFTLHDKLSLIGFSDNPDDLKGIDFLIKGFKGYINTFVTESIFNDLLNSVQKGDIWAGSSIVQKMIKQMLDQQSDRSIDLNQYDLSDREKETVNILITGASNKEIGRELGITERTVKAHVSSVLKKTNTVDRISLIIKLKDSNS